MMQMNKGGWYKKIEMETIVANTWSIDREPVGSH